MLNCITVVVGWEKRQCPHLFNIINFVGTQTNTTLQNFILRNFAHPTFSTTNQYCLT